MPTTSEKQKRTMLAVAHGWRPTGKAKGISRSVAKEFVKADKAAGRLKQGRRAMRPKKHKGNPY